MTKDAIVIIGTGHAGVQAAAALCEEEVDHPITLIASETYLPYERPPLSKQFLAGKVQADAIQLRDPAFYVTKRIELRLGERVVSIDRLTRRVLLAAGSTVSYTHLVLATGSRSRPLGKDFKPIDGVFELRSLENASALRARLACTKAITIVGAGFIGMEVAAVVAGLGCTVDVIEFAARPLGRSVSKITSDFLVSHFSRKGIRFHCGERLESFSEAGGRVRGLRLQSGKEIAADIVLVAIGALPCDRLARDSGLACPNGIEVDEAMRTADPHVSAIGDCTLHPNSFAGRMLRLESVQNAKDQARVLARRISGKSASYRSLPWFWSDLGDCRLQIAGLLDQCNRYIMRGSLEEARFAIYGFRDGALVGMESMNRPADYVLSKRLLETETRVRPEDVADENVDLRQFLNVSNGRGRGG